MGAAMDAVETAAAEAGTGSGADGQVGTGVLDSELEWDDAGPLAIESLVEADEG